MYFIVVLSSDQATSPCSFFKFQAKHQRKPNTPCFLAVEWSFGGSKITQDARNYHTLSKSNSNHHLATGMHIGDNDSVGDDVM
jgi:hypothetical protein